MYVEIEKLYGYKFPIITEDENLMNYYLSKQMQNSKIEDINRITKFKKVFNSFDTLDSYKTEKEKILDLVYNILKENPIMKILDFEEYFNNIKNKNKNYKNVVIHKIFKENSESKGLIELDIKEGNFNALKIAYFSLSEDLKKKIEINKNFSLYINSETFKEYIMKEIEFENKEEYKKINKELLELLLDSKSLRQVFFGKINPKKIETILNNYIVELVEELKITDDQIYIKSQDEVVFLPNEKQKEIIKNNKSVKFITKKEIEFDIVEEYTLSESKNEKKKYYVEKSRELSESNLKNKSVFKKTLKGVPKNIYFVMFKMYILEEEINDLDSLVKIENNYYKLIDVKQLLKNNLTKNKKISKIQNIN